MLTNPQILPKDKIIIVNGLVANYLMNEKKIPLLGKIEGQFCFTDSDEIKEILKKMPFWLKLNQYL